MRVNRRSAAQRTFPPLFFLGIGKFSRNEPATDLWDAFRFNVARAGSLWPGITLIRVDDRALYRVHVNRFLS